MYSALKVNFTNLMEFLDDARTFHKETKFFQNSNGEVHKVKATYIPNSPSSIFDIEINDMEMGGNYQDLGDAYQYLKKTLA